MDDSSDTCDCVDCQSEMDVVLGQMGQPLINDLSFDAGSDPLCYAHGEPRCPLCVKDSY